MLFDTNIIILASARPTTERVHTPPSQRYRFPLGDAMRQPGVLDEPPASSVLTDYDREHMKLYIRLLDSAVDGADWREAVAVLFDLDPDVDLERARRVHDSHLARARWMTEHGYRQLLGEGRH